MAAALLAKLERQIECELCLETLNDPRELLCRHTYCRSCVNDLLKFDNNGNATIKCPNNCDDKTLIGSNDTTKILPKNRELLKILEFIKEGKESEHIVGTTCKCKANISRWCTGCRLMFCKECYQTHDCNTKFGINGYYNFVKESFQPLCEEHDACIKHICLDCNNRFTCCYCRHREHRSHQVDTLENEAQKYKQRYIDDLDKINGVSLDFSYDDVTAKVFKFEKELELELNARIHLKVSSYFKKLNTEKEKILSQYKQAANNYKQSLNDSELTHKTFKESLESAKELLKQQSAFETLALKEDLNKRIKSITKLNVFKVSINEDENSDSLGTLKTEIMKKDLSDEHIAFCHDINLENKENYFGVMLDSKAVYDDFQKSSKRLYVSDDEETHLKTYNTEDIDALISNKDIQTLKKIMFINSKILSDNLSVLMPLTIKYNQSSVLDLMLKYYPDAVNVKGNNDNTLLLYAAKEGRTECVKVLLQNNANIQVRDRLENTSLLYAAWYGHHGIINILLTHGAHISSKGSFGRTPLLSAVMNGHKECVNVLLQHNANVNLKDNRNNTCLHYAASKGHHEIINILLNHGADINSKGYNGETPLMCAAMTGHKECVNMLLQHNADVNLKDDDNNICLYYSKGHDEIKQMLIQHFFIH